MTRHLIGLMWNRKRQNLLVVAEIFVAFLVVVALSVMAAHFGNNTLRPLGFSIDDVWTVELNRNEASRDDESARVPDAALVRQLIGELRTSNEVQDIAMAFTGPYRNHSWGLGLNVDGQPSRQVEMNRVDDRFDDALGVEVVAGRWFSAEDEGVGWEPVILNERLAESIFGAANPIGQTIREQPPSGPVPPGAFDKRAKRVVGVIRDFRQFGELSTPGNVMLFRMSLDAAPDRLELPEVLLLKLQPGTTAAFEEVLMRRARSIAPNWSFAVKPVAGLRESMLRDSFVLLIVVAIVAGAMLLMVALGLTGVVWQSVTQRMREFGLRRAQGATSIRIGRQVIAELVVMTSFAIVAGCVVLLQIPLLPLPPEIAVVPREVFVTGVVVAIAAVYLVTVVCAWYPSRLATRVPPTEALRYE